MLSSANLSFIFLLLGAVGRTLSLAKQSSVKVRQTPSPLFSQTFEDPAAI